MGALEIAAQCLADFPDAPWDLRMQLARQASDESRHVAGLYRRLQQLGGRKGEFPIGNFEWAVTNMCDTLAARLAIQNRTFEAGQMDLLGALRKIWRSVGDETTAEVLEHILADEINHVRFANRWIRTMVQEDRRLLLKVAIAIRFLAETNAALWPKPGGGQRQYEKHAALGVNVEDRRHADFSDDEINEIQGKLNEHVRCREGPHRPASNRLVLYVTMAKALSCAAKRDF
jgi:bacterioferritin (cytochrome b1)